MLNHEALTGKPELRNLLSELGRWVALNLYRYLLAGRLEAEPSAGKAREVSYADKEST